MLLVRGIQGNTMVVRCGTGWTDGDLSHSLRDRTAVPVFFVLPKSGGACLAVTSWWKTWADIGLSPCEGDILVARGTLRPFRESGHVLDVCGQGAGRQKSTCFRCGTTRPNIPLPLRPVPSNFRPARAPCEQRHPGRVPGNAAGGCPTASSLPLRPPLLHLPLV